MNTANALNGLRVESSGLVDRARDLDAPDEVSQAQDYFARDARAPPRRPGRGGRRHPRRPGRPGAPAEHQPRVADDAGVLRERRDLQPALRAQPSSAPSTRRRWPPRTRWRASSSPSPTGSIRRSWPIRWPRCARARTRATKPPPPASTATASAPSPSAAWRSPPAARRPSRWPTISHSRSRWSTRARTPRRTCPVLVTVGDIEARRAGRHDRRRRDEDRVDIAAREPPTGRHVSVEVEVEAVPGEEKTDNNSATFSVIFTQ